MNQTKTEMTCINCGAEWTMEGGLSEALTAEYYCPECQSSSIEEIED